MSFEEDFPTLIYRHKMFSDGNASDELITINTRQIQEKCLDKQKVKDAIEDILFCNCGYYNCQKCKLKKRLGIYWK